MTLLARSRRAVAGLSLQYDMRIPDFLKDRPKTAAELARDTQTHEDALHRLLRALASVGVFAETEEGRFALTPLSRTLCSEAPDSLRDFVMRAGAEVVPERYDFSKVKTVVDVTGGHGTFIAHVMRTAARRCGMTPSCC